MPLQNEKYIDATQISYNFVDAVGQIMCMNKLPRSCEGQNSTVDYNYWTYARDYYKFKPFLPPPPKRTSAVQFSVAELSRFLHNF